jgi:translation initiation factor IF-1
VVEIMRSGYYRIKLDGNDHMLFVRCPGKMILARIRVAIGDRVCVETRRTLRKV